MPLAFEATLLFVKPDVHLYVSVGRGGKKAFCFRIYESKERRWRTLDLNCKFEDKLPDAFLRDIMLEPQSRAAELTARLNRGENVFDQPRKESSHNLQELFVSGDLKARKSGESSARIFRAA